MGQTKRIGFKHYDNVSPMEDSNVPMKNNEIIETFPISNGQVNLINNINSIVDFISSEDFVKINVDQKRGYLNELILLSELNSELTTKTLMLR